MYRREEKRVVERKENIIIKRGEKRMTNVERRK